MKQFVNGKEVEFVRVPFETLKEDWGQYLVGDYLLKVKCCVSDVMVSVEPPEQEEPIIIQFANDRNLQRADSTGSSGDFP